MTWFPYPYGSHCHWLYGWATRINVHFDAVDCNVTLDDGYIFEPCEESNLALFEFGEKYPVQVRRIRNAVSIAEKCFDKFHRSKSDSDCVKYLDSLFDLSRLITTEALRIATSERVEIRGDPDGPDAIVTRTELQEHLGVTSGRINQRIKEGSLPKPCKVCGRSQWFSLKQINAHLRVTEEAEIRYIKGRHFV